MFDHSDMVGRVFPDSVEFKHDERKGWHAASVIERTKYDLRPDFLAAHNAFPIIGQPYRKYQVEVTKVLEENERLSYVKLAVRIIGPA